MRNSIAINGRPHKVAIEKPSVTAPTARIKRIRKMRDEKIPMIIAPPTTASVPGFLDAKTNSWETASI